MAKRKKYKTTNMNVLDKYRNKEQVFAIINQPNIIDTPVSTIFCSYSVGLSQVC